MIYLFSSLLLLGASALILVAVAMVTFTDSAKP
jgi:hypothetical protein